MILQNPPQCKPVVFGTDIRYEVVTYPVAKLLEIQTKAVEVSLLEYKVIGSLLLFCCTLKQVKTVFYIFYFLL